MKIPQKSKIIWYIRLRGTAENTDFFSPLFCATFRFRNEIFVMSQLLFLKFSLLWLFPQISILNIVRFFMKETPVFL